MGWWVCIARWFLFSVRYARLYWIYKKHEPTTPIPPTHFNINRTNNRLAFKIKDGYKLELETLGNNEIIC